jgi:transcriptional regulator with XRE-family HTH domain
MSDSFFAMRNEGGPLHVDGCAVYRARRVAGLTHAELAQRMRMLGYFLSQPYVSLVENGRYRWGFTERMATALAAALGVEITQITGGRLLSPGQARQIRQLTDEIDHVIGRDSDDPGQEPPMAAAG